MSLPSAVLEPARRVLLRSTRRLHDTVQRDEGRGDDLPHIGFLGELGRCPLVSMSPGRTSVYSRSKAVEIDRARARHEVSNQSGVHDDRTNSKSSDTAIM